MSTAFVRHKRRFRSELRPIFAMLQSKRSNMADVEWESLVRQTLSHVNLNPAEYLGTDLPDGTVISDVLAEIEREFLKDVRTFR